MLHATVNFMADSECKSHQCIHAGQLELQEKLASSDVQQAVPGTLDESAAVERALGKEVIAAQKCVAEVCTSRVDEAPWTT